VAQQSAGILLFRSSGDQIEFLIAHPGGPFWARRDDGAWSIPKGIIEQGEDPRATARREFIEEIGIDPGNDLISLGEVTQKSGKVVLAWGAEGDFDPSRLDSDEIEIEYPRGSGRLVRFPEIDRVIWAGAQVAKTKLNPAQADFIDRLTAELSER